jgi:Domain of unknown function (DUF4185)
LKSYGFETLRRRSSGPKRRTKRALLVSFWLLGPFLPVATPNDMQRDTRLPGFNYMHGWLGADDAYSVPLAPGKSLWLFGDTFVGDENARLRSQAKTMVRNSVAISLCEPKNKCTMRYFWRQKAGPTPRSFFDTGTDDLWYWPLDGFVRDKTLYISLLAVRNKPGAKSNDAFGFEIAGTKLATISNPQAAPDRWHVAIQDLTDARLWTGVSILKDGDYLIWFTQVSETEGRGYMTALRISPSRMSAPSSAWEYLRRDGQWASGLPHEDAMHLIDQPISEMSVRFHPSIHKWIALSTGPEFPPARAVVRLADSPLGPWSAAQTIYEFPEMKASTSGYDRDTFCYAVKEHIEFDDTKLALTYACNSMVLSKTVANMDIYRPRVVILDLPK